MLKKERKYQFRMKMLEVHKKNVRDLTLSPKSDEFEIKDGFKVVVPKESDEIILTAARDFTDYLYDSMNLSARVKDFAGEENENSIFLSLSHDSDVSLDEAEGERGYRIDVCEKGIFLYGYDSSGIAQGLYYLESRMNLRRAPYLAFGTIKRKPLFTPQMVHSGYGLDQFPNEHLSAIAHEGRDSILVFTNDVDKTPYGYLDFNELIYRAAKYGIGVYAYSYMKSKRHPDDEDAEEYYENTYGKLFKNCPGLKGVVLVGESIEFPSKDERVSPKGHASNFDDDGIPSTKCSPGWFPCRDYPDWLNLIKKIIRKYQPSADIVFWTYNWTRVDPELSAELISNLPTDISVLSCFEKQDIAPNKDGVMQFWTDYTLAFTGPSRMFLKEAEACKKRGIRLYAMTNTAGLTWDMGVLPYQPGAYAWIDRYKEMLDANEKYGLCGLMESHHYGIYPSFISKLSNMIFSDAKCDMEKELTEVISAEFGDSYIDEIKEALRHWSDANKYLTHSRVDSATVLRIGPGYPINLIAPINQRTVDFAHFGNEIVIPKCRPDMALEVGLSADRIPKELESWKKAKVFAEKGIEILEKIPEKNDNLLRLINMGKYMSCGITTGINFKDFYLTSLYLETKGADELKPYIEKMEKILSDEIENVERAIPLAEVDSRIGWEPSMEYIADAEHLRWKIKKIHHTEFELQKYKNLLK